MKIAICDYLVTSTNPAGSCHLQMLKELCTEHEFTVFSLEFENPCPARIQWVRIPAPKRPLAFLFVVYHVLFPIYYWLHRLRNGVRFDLVQVIESNALGGDIAYAHFCHAVYLREHWKDSGARGMRGVFRYIDHKLHAWMEPVVYRRAKLLVVPSRGLARELQAEYPWLCDKLIVLPNPVDLDHWRKAPGFDRFGFRRAQGFDENSFVLTFVALGQFERKGLPILLDVIAAYPDPSLQLFVVGGQPGLLGEYRRQCARRGLGGRVVFTGTQSDIRPHLWASDGFILPSSYEVFPLVCLQAAAAGIPLLATQLNGVEEFLVDSRNGFLIGRTAADVKRGVDALRALAPSRREAMIQRAQKDIGRYGVPFFTAGWQQVYDTNAAASSRILRQVA